MDDATKMLLSKTGFDTAAEIIAGQNIVQEHGNFRHGKRVVIARNTAPHVAQQTVVHMHPAKIVLCLDARQPFRLEQSSEYILESFELGPEAFQYLRRSVGAS